VVADASSAKSAAPAKSQEGSPGGAFPIPAPTPEKA